MRCSNSNTEKGKYIRIHTYVALLHSPRVLCRHDIWLLGCLLYKFRFMRRRKVLGAVVVVRSGVAELVGAWWVGWRRKWEERKQSQPCSNRAHNLFHNHPISFSSEENETDLWKKHYDLDHIVNGWTCWVTTTTFAPGLALIKIWESGRKRWDQKYKKRSVDSESKVDSEFSLIVTSDQGILTMETCLHSETIFYKTLLHLSQFKLYLRIGFMISWEIVLLNKSPNQDQYCL